MTFPVFLDTCVLYPATLCDTVLRVAETGAFRPHWSRDVMVELERNLARIETVGSAGAARRLTAMSTAFEDAEVTGYEPLIPSMTCDPKDRHVLAAAVASDCQVLVTFNIRDFPAAAVTGLGVEVVTPDDFLLDQIDLHPHLVIQAARAQMSATSRPHLTTAMLTGALDRIGLRSFAAQLGRHLDDADR